MYSFLHFITLFTFCEFFSLGTPEEYYLTIILAFIEPEEPPYSIKPLCATAAIQGSNNKSPTSQFETKNEIFNELLRLLFCVVKPKLKKLPCCCPYVNGD